MPILAYEGASPVKYCSNEDRSNQEERTPIGVELHTRAWLSRVGDDPSTTAIARREHRLDVADEHLTCAVCGEPNMIGEPTDGRGDAAGPR
jgi:hypothetical protein